MNKPKLCPFCGEMPIPGITSERVYPRCGCYRDIQDEGYTFIDEWNNRPVEDQLTKELQIFQDAGLEYKQERDTLQAQIDKLANYIMFNVPGEPSRSEGAVDCAIRIIEYLGRDLDLANQKIYRQQTFINAHAIVEIEGEFSWQCQNCGAMLTSRDEHCPCESFVGQGFVEDEPDHSEGK